MVTTAARPASGPVGAAPPASEPAWSRWLGVGIVTALGAAFVAAGWWRFTAPFGDNHDGSNGGVWVDAARAIIEHGPFDARLGSQLLTGGTYAHHPPLIAWVTAATDWLDGPGAFADRLPVILGSLAVIGLLVALLHDVGVAWIASAAGLAVGLATPLFFVYGPMIDTLPVSMPIGIALLLVWRRRATGGHAPSWLLAGLATLCVLSSWEALLCVVLAGVASLVLGRRDPTRLRGFLPMLVGGVVGLGLLTAWLFWATGSLGPLVDQLRYRSGTAGTEIGLVDSLREQWSNLGLVMGPARWLLLPAAVAGIWNHRTRLVMSVLVPTVVLYPVVLREAAVHDFWNLWTVAPLAIGIAAAVDAFLRVRPTRTTFAAVAVVVCIAAAASIVHGSSRDTRPARLFSLGLGAAHALDHAGRTGPVLYTVLPRGLNANWIELRTGSHVRPITGVVGLLDAGRTRPRAPVLLDCDQLAPPLKLRCRKRSPDPRAPFGGAYAVARVGDLLTWGQG